MVFHYILWYNTENGSWIPQRVGKLDKAEIDHTFSFPFISYLIHENTSDSYRECEHLFNHIIVLKRNLFGTSTFIGLFGNASNNSIAHMQSLTNTREYVGITKLMDCQANNNSGIKSLLHLQVSSILFDCFKCVFFNSFSILNLYSRSFNLPSFSVLVLFICFIFNVDVFILLSTCTSLQ